MSAVTSSPSGSGSAQGASVEPKLRDGQIVTALGGIAVPDLVAQFGTPLYVYDQAVIEARIDELKSFDVIRYAQKANNNLAILDLARRRGVLVDAVSVGEARRAMAAGYPVVPVDPADPPPIVYTADIFDRESLAFVAETGIHVNCGSPDMIEQLGRARPGATVTLRINPGFGHGHSQKTNTGGPQSKHGIWHEHLDLCRELATAHNVCITGLHMHIGSGADFEHLSQVASAMEQAAKRLPDDLTTISAGGGLPTPYRVTESRIDLGRYFEIWDAARKSLERHLGRSLHLEIEPGRYLVAESGSLIAEIRAIKSMGDNRFYVVDAGFNNLARPILYGAYHPMNVCPADASADRGSEEGPNAADLTTETVIVGGPLCESGDIFTQTDGGFVAARPLPQARIGDYLVIGCAGAYGAVMGSNYNGKPLAAEVLLRDGTPHLVRARQTFEDLIRGESIPLPTA